MKTKRMERNREIVATSGKTAQGGIHAKCYSLDYGQTYRPFANLVANP
jgi:hypothetical protein